MRIIPILDWYTKISKDNNLSPRCPYASVKLCPRYYESRALLGDAGLTTKIDSQDDKKLKNHWEKSDLWPVTEEQAVSISGGTENNPRIFSNFCPEVSFDIFGYFASNLSRYADEIDSDGGHRRLLKEGASTDDWGWAWSNVSPMHYSQCPLYSVLLKNIKTEHQNNRDDIILLKPNVFGIGLNIRALWLFFRRYFSNMKREPTNSNEVGSKDKKPNIVSDGSTSRSYKILKFIFSTVLERRVISGLIIVLFAYWLGRVPVNHIAKQPHNENIQLSIPSSMLSNMLPNSTNFPELSQTPHLTKNSNSPTRTKPNSSSDEVKIIYETDYVIIQTPSQSWAVPYIGSRNWYEACSFARNFKGGGWRLPSKEELINLPNAFLSTLNVQPDKSYWTKDSDAPRNAFAIAPWNKITSEADRKDVNFVIMRKSRGGEL